MFSYSSFFVGLSQRDRERSRTQPTRPKDRPRLVSRIHGVHVTTHVSLPSCGTAPNGVKRCILHLTGEWERERKINIFFFLLSFDISFVLLLYWPSLGNMSLSITAGEWADPYLSCQFASTLSWCDKQKGNNETIDMVYRSPKRRPVLLEEILPC